MKILSDMKTLFLIFGITASGICFYLGIQTREVMGIFNTITSSAHPVAITSLDGGSIGFGVIASACFLCSAWIYIKEREQK
ncbi:MAG: hypothetical protein Q7K21_03385 [Elusimicrobiota bacterium]|nr:hypothetical protein [Elusimicrobiota bacterium]